MVGRGGLGVSRNVSITLRHTKPGGGWVVEFGFGLVQTPETAARASEASPIGKYMLAAESITSMTDRQ